MLIVHGRSTSIDFFCLRLPTSLSKLSPNFVSLFFFPAYRIFNGSVAAEHLLEKCKNDHPNLKWACSARNKTKAETALKQLAETVENAILPEILQVDLLCKTNEEEWKLRSIVQSTKVCLTCSGPFELYGKKLVQMCAEEGVHYADITGETDFVREMISKYDEKARETGACIIPHCGNDCIPSDLTVFEMNKFAKEKGYQLAEVQLYEVRTTK